MRMDALEVTQHVGAVILAGSDSSRVKASAIGRRRTSANAATGVTKCEYASGMTSNATALEWAARVSVVAIKTHSLADRQCVFGGSLARAPSPSGPPVDAASVAQCNYDI